MSTCAYYTSEDVHAGSDHRPIVAEVRCSKERQQHAVQRKKRKTWVPDKASYVHRNARQWLGIDKVAMM